MTKVLCKYCGKNIASGGMIFTDFDGATAKTCWDSDCQTKYHWEQERIEFRALQVLKTTGKCIFKQLDGPCTAPVLTGEYYCKTHITERCCICGMQATRYCPKSSWAICDLSLCATHNHVHEYYH